jgi:DNA-binding transcriptional MerR regulator
MSEHIDRLCSELRIKLHGIDRRLEALKANGMATSETSQHKVESQLDRVEQRIYDNRIIVEAANARVKAWLDGKKASLDASRAGWKANRQVHLLNSRADDAEAYAGAVFDLAAAAADEAVQAALEALLARNDANRAALPESWVNEELFDEEEMAH